MSRLKQVSSALRRYTRADIYRRFLPYLRPYWLAMACVVGIEVGVIGLTLIQPWMTKILFDNGFSHSPLPKWLTTIFWFLRSESPGRIVLFAIFGSLLIRILRHVVDFVLNYFIKVRIRSGINFTFKTDMFHHIQRLSFSYHDRTTVGDSIYRINNDTGFVSDMVYSNPRYVFTSLLQLVAIMGIVANLDWVIAVLALAVAPLHYISIGFYTKLFKQKSLRVRAMESKVQTIIQEVLSCLRVVKAFGQEDREHRRLVESGWETIRARVRLEIQRGLFSEALGWISSLDSTLIMLICAFRVLDGHITLGELMVITSYVGEIHGPIETLGSTLTDMQSTMIDAERALQVLNLEPEIQDRPGAITLAQVEGAIRIEDVSFSYEKAKPVLHEINVDASPGQVIAIVGPTGAGKTTAASLIARFYDPESGKVTLDGHDLRDLTLQTLRNNIALVLQEPVLFSGSMRENIAYGRQDATMEEIQGAARAANAYDFISALSAGFDTEVGERGVRLSGGERQRISIARAFLKDAPVLILDEPTSSVDSRTEEVILDALDRLMVGRTTFIIAHRLSTVRHADQILVMDKGRIVERGTHDELLQNGGLYAHLFRIQSRGLRQLRVAAATA